MLVMSGHIPACTGPRVLRTQKGIAYDLNDGCYGVIWILDYWILDVEVEQQPRDRRTSNISVAK